MHKIEDWTLLHPDFPASDGPVRAPVTRLALVASNPIRFRPAHRTPSPYLDSRTKRLFDIVVAAGALAFFSPLLVLIALSVRLTSPGPVLFVQPRGGRGLKAFGLLKFRSMRVQPQGAAVVQATKDDRRVTAVGRILRKTSADELPQLINVLRGEMSVVGPRPHAVEHDRYYAGLIDDYCDRARSKPGITGLAQVSGLRGATPTTDLMAQRVAADIRYIETASLALDVSIVLRTAWSVLVCRGAY